ncbi:MAG: hypothetical protein ACYTGQ_03955 [Planctomycetota bacterium]
MKDPHGFNCRLENAIRDGATSGWRDGLRLCVPHLIELMESSHNRPMTQSRDAIRSVVADFCLRGDLGDMRDGSSVMLEVHVKFLVEELEKCRKMRIKGGDWSDVPVPPQMFG